MPAAIKTMPLGEMRMADRETLFAMGKCCDSEFQATAHDDAHNDFMTLPPHTSTRKDVVRLS